MRQTRRSFLKTTGAGLGALMLPLGLARKAYAMPGGNKTLVVLFMRGGGDGINICVPRGDEANYIALRKNDTLGTDITVPPAPPELQLDGFFELYPSMQALMPHYNSGELALVHAVGGTDNYSHFTAQDAMERAEPLNPTLVADGWMHRALQVLQVTGGLNGPALSLSGVSLSAATPKSLIGPDPAIHVAFPSISNFTLNGAFPQEAGDILEVLYQNAGNPLLNAAGGAVFDALGALAGIGSQPPSVAYPSGGGGFKSKLQDAARLIKNEELGVKMITLDYGGWDQHSNEINTMNAVGATFAGQIDAFWRDLGDAAERTVLLCCTEFGRTARVNGNDGTDHGWGSCMFALNRGMNGGRVLTRADPSAPGTGKPTPSGHWPGLGPGELHVQPGTNTERDLKATTDFRDVFGEVLEKFMDLPPDAVRDVVLRGYGADHPGLFQNGGGPGPGPGPITPSFPKTRIELQEAQRLDLDRNR